VISVKLVLFAIESENSILLSHLKPIFMYLYDYNCDQEFTRILHFLPQTLFNIWLQKIHSLNYPQHS